MPPDSGSMFLGLFPSQSIGSLPQTVGVEFDTCRNDGWDPPNITDHTGININSIISKSYTALPNMGLYGTMSANITYDGGSGMMKASLGLADGSSYGVEMPVDFMDAGVPQYANVGFSAATGVLTESHELLSCASVAGLVAAAALLWVIFERRRRSSIVEIELQVAKKFSYHELSTATGNFSEDGLLGAGAFGQVYKGELRDPRMPLVAVKRLTRMLDQTRREQDYVTEITTLGQLSHRNLIKLVGWCDGGGDNKLLLVYELVTNGKP
ncbi:hypothetical protein PR202_ga08447 [Eleusine coracana subsp. coracana]|uniref:non-specific serine/threonine protein kinase n=1 Tax=Eleusine coracana subsp. coracana TaxID=191504 RepID=A0AAV5C199_ELECO|nr:hypothetical protein PR202_ga08447 [Eleusine coracana subsp. coracana]